MDLLWRRAVEDPRQYRTFCLVHAENLPYHTSDQALQCLHEAMQGRKGTYNVDLLVIIESVDSISKDERGFPLTQYITNGRISRDGYTFTHFKHHHRVLRLISYSMSV